MTTIFSFLKRKLRTKSGIAVLGLLLLAGIWYAAKLQPGGTRTPLILVERRSIVQEVSVTGTTKPMESVELAFEKSGKVTRVAARIGDTVLPNKILVELDQRELRAQLLEAEASVQTQRAKLQELERGARAEDIRIRQTELQKAEQDLLNDRADVPDVLNDAYTKADEAIRKQLDELFSSDESINPQLTFSTTNAQGETDVEAQRPVMSQELNRSRGELLALGPASQGETLDAALGTAKNRLGLMRNFLNKVMDVVVSATSLSQTTLTAYKTSVQTALGNLNAAISSVSTQIQTIASQKILVEKSRDELDLKLAGSTPEEVLAQRAQVRQAEAKVLTVRAQIEKAILRSPIGGTVTKQDAKLGEIVSPNSPIVSVISEGSFEIEANVPEIDIGKISPGNTAQITLDAFPGEVFLGSVSYVEPAETIIDGVVNFKIKVAFEKADPRSKSGLTANLAIRTLEKKDVLVLPQVAILEKDEGSFVRRSKNGSIEEIPVTLGVRSQNGDIEIVSGVLEGDTVLNVGFKESGT